MSKGGRKRLPTQRPGVYDPLSCQSPGKTRRLGSFTAFLTLFSRFFPDVQPDIMADPSAGPPPLVSAPHENEGSRILAATLATTALALITVGARLFVRLGIIRNFGWDVSGLSRATWFSLTTADEITSRTAP